MKEHWKHSIRRPAIERWSWMELNEYRRTDGCKVYETVATQGELRAWCVSVPDDVRKWGDKTFRKRFATAQAAMDQVDIRHPLKP